MSFDKCEKNENINENENLDKEKVESTKFDNETEKVSFKDKMKESLSKMFGKNETGDNVKESKENENVDSKSDREKFLERIKVTPEQLEKKLEKREPETKKGTDSVEGTSDTSRGEKERSLENDALHRINKVRNPEEDPYR